jgi:[citrate (pro-3S)-lyase] ligase
MTTTDTNFRIETIDINSKYDVKWISEFINPLGFKYETIRVDATIALCNSSGVIVGTGSYQGNVLKYLAVADEYRETPAFATITTHLFNVLMNRYKTVFVYTKPANIIKFEGLGFKLIAKADPLYAVLELGTNTIEDYKEYLKSKKRDDAKTAASIVMNCNPFTNGHRYLIEQASSNNDILYLFVVEEDRSVFPFKTRWELIEKGIKHLNNVIMLKGSNYVISGATFPSYFLKEAKFNEITEKQTELDVNIFCEHIVPVMNINRRYVGTEVYCQTTAEYNKTMAAILPKYNVELIEIERKTINNSDNYISASKVRAFIKSGQIEELKKYVPDTTFNYLKNDPITI